MVSTGCSFHIFHIRYIMRLKMGLRVSTRLSITAETRNGLSGIWNRCERKQTARHKFGVRAVGGVNVGI